MLNYAAKLAILVLGLFALLLPAGGEGREFLSYNSISSANIATFNPANPVELKWHSLELVPPQDASSLTQDVTFVFDGVRKTVRCDGSLQTIINTYPEIPVTLKCTLGPPDPNGVVSLLNVEITINDQATYQNYWPDAPGSVDPQLGSEYCRAYTSDGICEFLVSCQTRYCRDEVSLGSPGSPGDTQITDWGYTASGCCSLDLPLCSSSSYYSYTSCGRIDYWWCEESNWHAGCYSDSARCYSYEACTTTYRCNLDGRTYAQLPECEASCGSGESCLDAPFAYCETDSSGAQACKRQVLNQNSSLLISRGVPPGTWIVYSRTTASLSLGVGTAEVDYPEGYFCVYDMDGSGEIDQSEISACINVDDTYLCLLDLVECQPTYSEPICPPGGSLNASRDVCEAQPQINCPSGFTYSRDLDKCVADPSCPSGGSFNPAQDRCEIRLSSGWCPQNYWWNDALKACVRSPVCPEGGYYDPQKDYCVHEIIYSCPSGFSFDQSERVCWAYPSCPSGFTYNSTYDLCVKDPTWTCPSGMTYDSSRHICKASPSCPGSGTYNTNLDRCTVLPSYTCPSGYTKDSNRQDLCYASPVCPSGFTFSGTHDLCLKQAVPTCPSGYTYNSSTGKCERSPVCPSGSTYNPFRNRCEANPSCPSGGTFDYSLGKCRADDDWRCSANNQIYEEKNQCVSSCSQTGTCTAQQSCTAKYCRDPFRYHDLAGVKWIYIGYETGCCASLELADEYPCYCDLDEDGKYKCSRDCPLDWDGVYRCPETCYLYVFDSTPISELAWYCCGRHEMYEVCGSYCTHLPECPQNVQKTECGTIKYDSCSISQWHYYCSEESAKCYSYQDCTTTGWTCSLNGQTYSDQSQCEAACGAQGTCSIVCPSGYSAQNDMCVANPSCPSGFTYSGGFCIANPSCPNGGTLNTATDKCELTPTPSCPSGSRYDSVLQMCVANPSCPSPGSYNSSTNRCEVVVSPTCPSSYTYNSSTGFCEASAVCPSSSSLNPSTDLCEAAPQPQCPSGSSWSSSIGKCVASPICSQGYLDPAQDRCEVVPTSQCLPGYSLSGNECRAQASCPYGTLNTQYDFCVVPGGSLCPSPYTWNGELCISNPVCSPPSVYLAEVDLCVVGDIHLCPDQYAYNPISRMCEAYPVCPSGSYDPEKDMCYQGNTTCPYGPDYPCIPYQDTTVCSAIPCVTGEDVEDLDDSTEGANDPQNDGQWTEEGECLGTIYIFSGKDMRCRLPGIETGWFNCCDGGDTWFGLGKCKGTEQALAVLKKRGLCHKVGTYCSKKILGACVQKKATYCCFNSKLARIVHEQGRPQLQSFAGDLWGRPKSPRCRGFTAQEFQMLDFDRIDLSEWFGDIQVRTQVEIANEIQQRLGDYMQNLQGGGQ